MDLKQFFEFDLDLSGLRHMGLAAPLSLAIAVAATVGVGWFGKQLAQETTAVASQVQLVQQAATPDELAAVAKRLKAIAPSLAVEAVGPSLLISGKAGTYTTWVYAISSVPSMQGGLLWSTRSMCVNTCGNGVAYRVDLTANKQVLQGAGAMGGMGAMGSMGGMGAGFGAGPGFKPLTPPPV